MCFPDDNLPVHAIPCARGGNTARPPRIVAGPIRASGRRGPGSTYLLGGGTSKVSVLNERTSLDVPSSAVAESVPHGQAEHLLYAWGSL